MSAAVRWVCRRLASVIEIPFVARTLEKSAPETQFIEQRLLNRANVPTLAVFHHHLWRPGKVKHDVVGVIFRQLLQYVAYRRHRWPRPGFVFLVVSTASLCCNSCNSSLRFATARSSAGVDVSQSLWRSLKAWVHSFFVKPRMHQSMHNGSMARAASALPRSAVSQPNWSLIWCTTALALSLLPQMNIVGLPLLYSGLIIRALPTELYALTKCASGTAACNCSISDRSRLVKNLSTPLTGGASAIGLVASMTGLPARFAAPAILSTSAATVPLTASTTISPNFAASAKLATCAPLCSATKSLSLPVSRVPSAT